MATNEAARVILPRLATPLHYACVLGHRQAVSALLQFGADAEIVDGDGHTVLHLAMEHGHVEILEDLVKSYSHLLQATNVSVFKSVKQCN